MATVEDMSAPTGPSAPDRVPEPGSAVWDPALAAAPYAVLLAERLLMHRIVTTCLRDHDFTSAAAAARCISALADEMDRRDCAS